MAEEKEAMTHPVSISDAERTAQKRAEDENEQEYLRKLKDSQKVYKKLLDKAQAAIRSTDEANSINPETNAYTDLRNGSDINHSMKAVMSEDAVTLNTDGNHEVYELIPASRLKKKVIVEGNAYNSVDAPLYLPSTDGQDKFYEMDAPDDEYINEQDTLEYDFGIDSVTIAEKSAYKTSGFISPEITLGENCYHIELAGPSYTGLEYSIIDGDKETPILPQEQTKVVDEKLFYQMPTRFTVENPDSVVIRVNGTMTNYGYGDIMDLPRSADNEYTISYTPSDTGHSYIPKNRKIRVKIIQRLTDTKEQPKPIQQVIIKSYGGIQAYGV